MSDMPDDTAPNFQCGAVETEHEKNRYENFPNQLQHMDPPCLNASLKAGYWIFGERRLRMLTVYARFIWGDSENFSFRKSGAFLIGDTALQFFFRG